MNRMQRIVERGKAELEKKRAVESQGLASQQDPMDMGRTRLEYTTTRVVEVSHEAMLRQRLIAVDETDPRATRFQILRTKTLQQMRKKGWNSLGISAPTPGAGKSLVAANLAVSMAMEGNQTVLLVDMDLRKPALHRYFGLEPRNGIHDVLEGTATVEDTLINPGIERLVVLPGRKGTVNNAAQISAPVVKAVVDELKARYESRIVIFDLPPVLVNDDVMVFLPYVDCSLLIVESGRNNKKDVEDSLAAIGSHPVLGTVLNKATGQETALY